MTDRTTITWFAGGMLVALLVAGLGWPVVANARPSQPQQGIARLAFTGSSPLVIPAAEFRSDGSDSDAIFFSFIGGYFRGEQVNSCLMAPVYLPQFATISEIYATTYDNDSNARMWIELYRVNNYTGIVDELAYMETTSNMDAVQILSDPSITHPNVSYPYYSYYLGTCLESTATRIYSVRIYYTENLIFLPTIFRNS
ncbi:MAG: hypothetical protein GF414_09590 [Candidatus Altiarchaeales archaeon]|jgi:hypothetical protein|nr:hypothetical protein [Candidatus Altiarchaeales archaeon]